jgi:CubicO group peptidase (beta-lactamase class C family)
MIAPSFPSLPRFRTECALVALAAALFSGPALLDAQEGPERFIAAIEAPREPGADGPAGLTLAELLEATGVPAVSVAVVHGFQLHWARAWGVADVVTGRAADTETLFQAASISKPVAAMGVLRLAREDALSLDADVNRLLRRWQVPGESANGWGPVTLRSLLSHTSGADDGFGFPGYAPEAERPGLVGILNGEAPSNVGPVHFARPPFEAYKYSGGGTTLVQLAVEDLTGRPFAEFMEEAVLGPLGMSSSSYLQPLPPPLASRAARAHDAQGAARDAPWHVYPEQAAAGLWTTAEDLARFIVEVQQASAGLPSHVLDPTLAREMTTPVGVGPFGVGLMVDKRGEGWYFSHGGSNRGFRGMIVGHTRKGYGVAILTNADGGTAVTREIEARVAQAYGWDVLDAPLRR